MAKKKRGDKKDIPEIKRRGRQPNFGTSPQERKYEIDYLHFYESLYRREVTDWLDARIARRDPFNPITYPIQQLYKDSMLDNHLQGAFESRVLRVLNKIPTIKDAEGNIDRMLSAQIRTRWFRHLVRRAMESIAFGYSLIYVDNLMQPDRNVIDLPRENVIPERGILVKNSFDPNSQAIPYKEYPNHFFYIQLNPDAIGILERVAPMTIFKRHSWAAWDQFEQIFGIPIRIARTMIQEQKHLDNLQMWLETMGTASYGIFPKQVDIELKENQRSDAYQVFYEKVQAINKEISKGVIGQTMTMEDGASQSQAEVHLQIFDEITSADIQNIQDWITDDVFPVLRYWGLTIPEGYYCELIEKTVITPEKKILIDDILLRHGYNIKPEYIEETYDTPLDEAEPRRAADPQVLSVPQGFDESLKDFFV